MRKILVLFAVAIFVLVSGAFGQERDTIQNHMNQVQALQAEIAEGLKVRQALLEIKDLILKGDEANKEETAKLEQAVTNFVSDAKAYEADKSAWQEEFKRWKTEDSTLKPQIDTNRESIKQHNDRVARHNSSKPNPKDHAAVGAYNAEASRLDAEGASLNAQKAQLAPAEARWKTWATKLQEQMRNLEEVGGELENRRKALIKKEDDLKWAREKLNEQTLKWAEDTTRNNARLNDLAAQLNNLFAKISQLSSKCSSIEGVGKLELGNLNAASEQAVRCLQQLWDGAPPGTSIPVPPGTPPRPLPDLR